MSETASSPSSASSALSGDPSFAGEVPPHLWLRSGRPLVGTATRVYLAVVLIATALIFAPQAPVYWGLIGGGVLVYFLFPVVVQGLLKPVERRVLAVRRKEATGLLQEVRGRRLVKQFAPHAWVTLQEGRLHLRRGDGKAAARAFAETMRLSRGAGEPALVSAQAQALLIAEQPEQARELLQALAKKGPLSASDRLHLGLALLAGKGSGRDALEHVQAAAQTLGGHPRVLAGLALALHRADETSEALMMLQRAQDALGADPDPFDEGLVQRGVKLLRTVQKAQQKRERKVEPAARVAGAAEVNAPVKPKGEAKGEANAAEEKAKTARRAKKDERRAARRAAKAEKRSQPESAKGKKGKAAKLKPEAKAVKVAAAKLEAKPVAVVKVETKAEAKPVEVKAEAKPVEAKPVVVKAETKPVEVKAEAKPVEVKVEVKAEAKPVEVKAEAKPVEVKAEAKPVAVEERPVAAARMGTPVEARPIVQMTPVEVRPIVQMAPAEVRPSVPASAGPRPAPPTGTALFGSLGTSGGPRTASGPQVGAPGAGLPRVSGPTAMTMPIGGAVPRAMSGEPTAPAAQAKPAVPTVRPPAVASNPIVRPPAPAVASTPIVRPAAAAAASPIVRPSAPVISSTPIVRPPVPVVAAPSVAPAAVVSAAPAPVQAPRVAAAPAPAPVLPPRPAAPVMPPAPVAVVLPSAPVAPAAAPRPSELAQVLPDTDDAWDDMLNALEADGPSSPV